MWPGWASLELAQKPHACKIQSWKATLRSTIHLVICSEPQLKYQSLCLHVNERLNNKRRKSKKLGSKNIKVEMCVHSASRTYPYQNTILLSILGDAMQNFSLSISLVAHSDKLKISSCFTEMSDLNVITISFLRGFSGESSWSRWSE